MADAIRGTATERDDTTRIASPNNPVLVFGRVLVYADSDLPIAHYLVKQIQISAPPNPSNDSDTTP